MSTSRMQLLLLVAHPHGGTQEALAGAIAQFLEDYSINSIEVRKAATPRGAMIAAHELKEQPGLPSAVAIMPYTFAQEHVDDACVREHLEQLGFNFVLLGGVPPYESNAFDDLAVCDADDADGIVQAIVRAVPAARVL